MSYLQEFILNNFSVNASNTSNIKTIGIQWFGTGVSNIVDVAYKNKGVMIAGMVSSLAICGLLNYFPCMTESINCAYFHAIFEDNKIKMDLLSVRIHTISAQLNMLNNLKADAFAAYANANGYRNMTDLVLHMVRLEQEKISLLKDYGALEEENGILEHNIEICKQNIAIVRQDISTFHIVAGIATGMLITYLIGSYFGAFDFMDSNKISKQAVKI